MTKAKRAKTLGEVLIEGAREALAYKRGELRGVRVTYAMVTVRCVDVLPPPEYGEEDVRRIRRNLGLSQSVFAKLLGASASTVRAWERGARQPSDMARRLMALVEREPQAFEKDLVPNGTPRANGHGR